MINQFPSEERPINQVNRGDGVGTFWSSKNVDLQSNFGVIRLAPRLLLAASVATDATFNMPVAIKEFDTKIWAICGGKIYENAGEINEAWVIDASTGARTDYTFASDLETFNNVLYASNDNGLYGKPVDGAGEGAWTQRVAGADAGILQYFRKFNRLYISDTNVFDSINTAEAYAEASSADDYTITLPAGFIIQSSCETTDSIWIGTINNENDGTRGSIFRWDGLSAQTSERYYIQGSEVLAMVTMDDVPYCMDTFGILYKFTGSSFDEIGRLPFGKHVPVGASATSLSTPRFIHRQGIQVTKDKTLLINVANLWELSAEDQVIENMPSGIWEWSPDFGLTHKYGFGYTPRETTTITDWGQFTVYKTGALAYLATLGATSADQNGSILAGANYYTDNDVGTTAGFGLFYDDCNDLIQKKGYFTTSWIDSLEIQDKWERLWTTYRRFLDSSDSIVMKYRINEIAPTLNSAITWIDTTSFSTAIDVTAYGPTSTTVDYNGTQGGEVEITQGVGAGLTAHITAITGSGPYTVRIDEVATGATTTTARANFQHWIKLNPESAQDQINSYSSSAIGASNTRIQLKCCMTFTGANEFTKFALVSNEDITISP